jgi:mono/diheme cytochrome c family protein
MKRKSTELLQMKSLVVAFAILFPLLGHSAPTTSAKVPPVTPAEGESWLAHIHRNFDATSMGKTGHLGPPAPMPGENSVPWHMEISPGFASQTRHLHGFDVYRLDCRGCHTESGQGAPPEINSVIEPVRSTSVPIIRERMQKRGMEIGKADATVLANQAGDALLLRFHKGGQNMPAFSQLNENEIRALLAYLKQLSGIPGAEKSQVAIDESPYRVGELLVKSTCHVCHGAVGPNPNPEQIAGGAIPPLSTLASRAALPEFVRKVTAGAPIVMGSPALPCRGRMPVFDYLSQDEAADIYLYLTLYPPRP